MKQVKPFILIFLLSAISIIFLFIYSQAKPIFQSQSSIAGEIIGDAENMYRSFDQASVFILLALYGTTIVTGIFIRSHPVFFVLSVLGLVFSLVGVVAIANVWEIFTGVFIFSGITANYFTGTTTIMNNAPMLSIFGIILWAVGFYAKGRYS